MQQAMPTMPLIPAPLREWMTSSAALQLPSIRAVPAAETSCARGIDSNDALHTFHFNRYMFILKPHTSHTSHLTHTPHLTSHASHLIPHTAQLPLLFRFSIGDDFQWEAALEPFSLWDELIDAVNADGRVRVQYSTLEE